MEAAEAFPGPASWYERFAAIEAPGQSAIYEEWALGVSTDRELLDLLAELPRPKQQPNLLFACSRLLGAPVGAYGPWRDWVLANWADVRQQILARSTQTNEPRRCATLLPVLGLIDGPIALLEVGASAGLCLYPDRYSYDYDGVRLDPVDGPSRVLLDCHVTGDPPLPTAMPDIVWRAGLDLNPLDVGDSDAVTWLETLIWPEQTERLERIRRAIDIVRADPPRLVAGDATAGLAALAAEAPRGATLVIVTSAALVYLMPDNRAAFIELARSLRSDLGARWISNEGRGIVPLAAHRLGDRQAPEPHGFVVALDEHPVAFSAPHGQRLDWLPAGL